MKNSKKTSIQIALDNLVSEIKELADKHSETDLDQLLADQIGQTLAEKDQVYGTSIIAFLDVAVALSSMEIDQKGLDVQCALRKVTDKHLLGYIDCIDDVKHFILDKEPAGNDDTGNINKWRQALRSVMDLEGHVNAELYCRVQGYGNDIKRLREAS